MKNLRYKNLPKIILILYQLEFKSNSVVQAPLCCNFNLIAFLVIHFYSGELFS